MGIHRANLFRVGIREFSVGAPSQMHGADYSSGTILIGRFPCAGLQASMHRGEDRPPLGPTKGPNVVQTPIADDFISCNRRYEALINRGDLAMGLVVEAEGTNRPVSSRASQVEKEASGQ